MSCEIADVYQVTLRKARKEHKCWNCRGRIEKGERYAIHQILFDGLWDNIKLCADCQQIHKDLNAPIKDPYEQITIDDIWDACFNAGNSDYDAFGRRLLATMRKRGAVVPDWVVKKFEGRGEV